MQVQVDPCISYLLTLRQLPLDSGKSIKRKGQKMFTSLALFTIKD